MEKHNRPPLKEHYKMLVNQFSLGDDVCVLRTSRKSDGYLSFKKVETETGPDSRTDTDQQRQRTHTKQRAGFWGAAGTIL